MVYETTTDMQLQEEFIEYFQTEDEASDVEENGKDRVINVYPVFVPDTPENKEENESIKTPNYHQSPTSLLQPKLGEHFPVFSRKLSDIPPVFKP